jgi:hypothetical protein
MKAFPSSEPIYQDNVIGVKQSTGMDLRDYFAACAMQGFLTEDCDVIFDSLAHESYRVADEMMKAREK